MKNRDCVTYGFLAVIFIALSSNVFAEQDSIASDHATGNYVITYRSYSGEMVHVIWEPATKIDPIIKWNVKKNTSKPDVLSYRYEFKNGKEARQSLEGGRFLASMIIGSSQTQPSGWNGTVANDWGRSSGVVVGWSFFHAGSKNRNSGGIKPNSALGGFGLESTDLPGIGTMELWGYVPTGRQSLPDEGPSEMSPIRNQFVDLQRSDFVARNTAVPLVAVGNPYDATLTLNNLRNHISQDVINLKLIETNLAFQLDRWLKAAADAISLNNTKAARENLHEAMKLLKKEHPDCDKEDMDKRDDSEDDGKYSVEKVVIDRLAAQIIAFDIKYVDKRLK